MLSGIKLRLHVFRSPQIWLICRENPRGPYQIFTMLNNTGRKAQRTISKLVPNSQIIIIKIIMLSFVLSLSNFFSWAHSLESF